jgi:hypothetical protein
MFYKKEQQTIFLLGRKKRRHMYIMSQLERKRLRRILSLDGGGTRGFFTYRFLLKVQNEISDLSFDLLVGTSVGAIVIAALGCGFFRVENKSKLENMVEHCFSVFGENNSSQPLFAPVYTGKEKEALLHRYFGNLRLKDCTPPIAVVTASVSGHRKVFTSTQDPELLLADVLNASSAAPVYFPPVKIQDTWYMDGGCISNSPVDVAVIQACSHFPDCDFRILSIGTQNFTLRPIQILKPNEMGLIAWFNLGLVDMLLGVTNTNMVEVLEKIYGSNLLRIVANVHPSFDDVSFEFQVALATEAERAYVENTDRLKQFFS